MVKGDVVEVSGDYLFCVWRDMKMNEEGESLDIRTWRHMSVQATGDLGGAMISMAGSIVGDHEHLFYVEGVTSSDADVRSIQPRVVGGDEHTTITIGMMLRR